MSDETEPVSPRIYLVIGVVALLAVGAWWLFSDDEPPDPEQTMGSVDEADEPEPAPEPPPPPPLPEPEPEPEPDYDELAQMLFDGSVPEEVAPYDPPLPTTGVPETPEQVEARRAALRARQEAERDDEEAPRGPGTPAEQLAAATAWRGLLDGRLQTLRGQLEEFEASGDEARAQRARRLIERLEGQRPGLSRRIRDLQATVGPM